MDEGHGSISVYTWMYVCACVHVCGRRHLEMSMLMNAECMIRDALQSSLRHVWGLMRRWKIKWRREESGEGLVASCVMSHVSGCCIITRSARRKQDAEWCPEQLGGGGGPWWGLAASLNRPGIQFITILGHSLYLKIIIWKLFTWITFFIIN